MALKPVMSVYYGDVSVALSADTEKHLW